MNYLTDSFGGDFAIHVRGSVAIGDFHEDFAVAHADAAGLFEDEGIGMLFEFILKGFIDFFAAGRYSTGSQSDFNRLHSMSLINLVLGFLFGFMFIRAKDLTQFGRSQAAVGFVVYDDHRGE